MDTPASRAPSRPIGNRQLTTEWTDDDIKALRAVLLPALARVREAAEARAAGPRTEKIVSERSAEALIRVVSLGEGWHTFEAAGPGFGVSRAESIGALAKALAALGSEFLKGGTESSRTDADALVAAIDAINGESARLARAVDAPVKGVMEALGLPDGAADVAAGAATKLMLAPITGPLDKAETYLEVAGSIFGLLTGAHGLVLVCLKSLLHRLVNHLVARGVVELLDGSETAHHRPDTPPESPWLCLTSVPEPPAKSRLRHQQRRLA